MPELRDRSPTRKELTKSRDNPWPACDSGCSDDIVNSDCEFDNDEELRIHHCIDCREKWPSDHGYNCDVCGDFWCPDWQSAFVSLKNCLCKDSWKLRRRFVKEHMVSDPDLEFVCPTCAIKDGLLCLHPECDTSVIGLLRSEAHCMHEKLLVLLKKLNVKPEVN
jgi:hypothetical protein